MLFSNPTIAELMNERFVSHWVNVRDVPKVTIDFGNGRVLERTLNGNIATYVCLPDGRTLDVITGLNDAETYLKRLREALELYAAVSEVHPDRFQAEKQRDLIRIYHEVALSRGHAAAMKELSRPQTMSGGFSMSVRTYEGDLSGVGRFEESFAVSKARVEAPLKRAIAIDPALPPEKLAELFPEAAARSPFLRVPARPREAMSKGMVEVPLKDALKLTRLPAEGTIEMVVEEPRALERGELPPEALSKMVVEEPLKGALKRGAKPSPKDDLITKARDTLRYDSEHNGSVRRLQVHRLMLLQPFATPEQLAKRVYKEILHVDIEDPYLGLAPMVLGGEIGRSEGPREP